MRCFRVQGLRCQGMTLIELMISVAIMAVIASGAFKVYSNLQSAHDQIDFKTEQLDSLQRFWQLFRQDTSFALYRKIRIAEDQFGPEGERIFDVSPESVAGQAGLVQWSRSGGLPNIMLKTPQSELRRVAYGLDGQKLYRFQWDQMDPAKDSQPQSALLLDNVIQFNLRYGYVQPGLSENGADTGTNSDTNTATGSSDQKKQWKWASQWPLPSESLNSSSGFESNEIGRSNPSGILMPSVVELTLQVDNFGSMTRLFEFGAPDAGAWHTRKEQRVQPKPANPDDPSNADTSKSDVGEVATHV